MCITVKDRIIYHEEKTAKVMVEGVDLLESILGKELFLKREFDSCLQFFTNQIAQNVDYINAFEFFYCQIRENKCTNMG